MTHVLNLDDGEPAEPLGAAAARRPALRMVAKNGRVDLDAAERAAADFLAALGIELDREDRRDTPARMARAYAELFDSEPFQLTTFPRRALRRAGAGPCHPVPHRMRASPAALRRGRPRRLPAGRAHLGAVQAGPGRGPLRGQAATQERLTKQVADCIDVRVRPRGVGVVLEAEHSCMTLRGARAIGARTVTSSLLGTLRTDAGSRAEFFALTATPR